MLLPAIAGHYRVVTTHILARQCLPGPQMPISGISRYAGVFALEVRLEKCGYNTRSTNTYTAPASASLACCSHCNHGLCAAIVAAETVAPAGWCLTACGLVRVCTCLCARGQAREWYREDLVGQGLAASGVPRGEVFITSKLHPRHLGADVTRKQFNQTLRWVRCAHAMRVTRTWPHMCTQAQTGVSHSLPVCWPKSVWVWAEGESQAAVLARTPFCRMLCCPGWHYVLCRAAPCTQGPQHDVHRPFPAALPRVLGLAVRVAAKGKPG